LEKSEKHIASPPFIRHSSPLGSCWDIIARLAHLRCKKNELTLSPGKEIQMKHADQFGLQSAGEPEPDKHGAGGE
tara:strand:- start:114 stop:338 length:225 start_codon:yes stop_codon:yes gene_type:complete